MTLPDPLTPADSDLSDFGFMPLDVGRFRRSDLVTQEEPEAIVAAILLWGAAWHSKPAASLSNDDRSLAQAAGFGRAVDAFRAVKEGALRGFIQCADGRLYHPVVAEKAREAWDAKLKRLWRTECARVRKWNERHDEAEQLEAPTFEDYVAKRYAVTSHATNDDVTRDNPPASHETPAESHARHAEDGARQIEDAAASAIAETLAAGEIDAQGVKTATSQATGANVARDIDLDSCARAEKGQGEGQGQGDSNRLRSTTSIGGEVAEPDQAPIEDPFGGDGILDRLSRIGRIAGLNLTQPAKLATALDTLKGWLAEGMDFDATIFPTIERVTRENPSEPIYSLRYFDAAVRKAHGVTLVGGKSPAPPPPPKPAIAAQDGEDERVGRFRARLKYAVGDGPYEAQFAPHHVAADVVDDRFLELTFRASVDVAVFERGAERSLAEQAAKGLGLILKVKGLK